jgi:hypothetical protein
MKKRFGRQELITFGVLLALGAAACVVLLFVPPGSPHAKWLPKCMFHQLTGLYCPGCGATRALSAMLHGDVKASLHNNLLLFPLLALIVYLIVKPQASLKRPFMIAVLAVILAFTVLRNIPVAPFTCLAPVPARQSGQKHSEEPDAESRSQSDQDEHGGKQENPEPAERQGALR